MRREVLAFLQATARRLLLVRAMESAAVLAVAAGLCAAALELAWIAAWRTRLVAALICTLPAVGGAAMLALPAARRRLRMGREVTLVAAGFSILIGAAGAVLVGLGWHMHVSRAALPLLIVPAGAAAGAVARIVRGVSLQAAAIFVDARAGLCERLSTAAELAASPDRDKPFAEYLYAQASSSLRGTRLGRPPMWKRSRATAGALGLVVMLCLTLALLPTAGAGRHLQDVLAGLGRMTPSERAELSAEFRRAAGQAQGSAELAEQLSRAADAIEITDSQRLEEALSDIEQSLALSPERTTAAVSEILEAAAERAAGGASASEGPTAPIPSDQQEKDDHEPLEQHEHMVLVYDPLYDQAVTGRSPETGHAAPDLVGRDATQGMVRKADAWAAARERAAGALQSGQVPARYRQLIRNFFLNE